MRAAQRDCGGPLVAVSLPYGPLRTPSSASGTCHLMPAAAAGGMIPGVMTGMRHLAAAGGADMGALLSVWLQERLVYGCPSSAPRPPSGLVTLSPRSVGRDCWGSCPHRRILLLLPPTMMRYEGTSSSSSSSRQTPMNLPLSVFLSQTPDSQV